MDILFFGILLIVLILLIVILFLLTKKKDAGGLNKLDDRLNTIYEQFDKLEEKLRNELGRNREENSKNAKEGREELTNSFHKLSERNSEALRDAALTQKNQLEFFSKDLKSLTKTIEDKLDKVSETIENRLKSIQEDNSKKLEQMRETVDEKLHKTLEERLGQSFKLVSDQLEQVQKGLGEMQTLANGVGDLKKVLSNVKTKGILGEYQLENILEQILTPEQYDKNVKTNPDTQAFVEFAIKLPGKKDADECIWLPVDSKFPTEPYQLLMDAYESGDLAAIEMAKKSLSATIQSFAKDISDKYIAPPHTTDFAIMFLPIEGLYAEVLRDPGLMEILQRKFKITITGPTTLSALLSSLQMGFRTLAIEKRSSEVWKVLGAVKTEFATFEHVLNKAQTQINAVGSSLDKLVGTRTRAIERKLRDVVELPAKESEKVLTAASSIVAEDN